MKKTWYVAQGLFELIIILWLLISLKDPLLKTIIPVLGVIYLTVQGSSFGNGALTGKVLKSVERFEYRYQHQRGGEFIPEITPDQYKDADTKLYIDLGFLMVKWIVFVGYFFMGGGVW